MDSNFSLLWGVMYSAISYTTIVLYLQRMNIKTNKAFKVLKNSMENNCSW
jgi:hypothetical protein